MKRTFASALLAALALLCGAAAASPATSARHAEARFGSWRATLVMNADNGRTVVRVWHRGRLMLARHVLAAADIRFLDTGYPRGFACCGTPPIAFEFLNGRDPQVVMTLFTGGKYCCTLTRLVDFNASRPRIVTVNANTGARVQWVRGRPVFVGGDDRFQWVFACQQGCPFFPIRIWRYGDAVFHDVTRSYPRLIAADAASWFGTARDIGPWEAQSVFAAWAADEALLGRAAFARATLERLADRGRLQSPPGDDETGRAYVARLWRFLVAKGYL
jgi:hypothetical protein